MSTSTWPISSTPPNHLCLIFISIILSTPQNPPELASISVSLKSSGYSSLRSRINTSKLVISSFKKPQSFMENITPFSQNCMISSQPITDPTANSRMPSLLPKVPLSIPFLYAERTIKKLLNATIFLGCTTYKRLELNRQCITSRRLKRYSNTITPQSRCPMLQFWLNLLSYTSTKARTSFALLTPKRP